MLSLAFLVSIAVITNAQSVSLGNGRVKVLAKKVSVSADESISLDIS
jgi:hypothetical protein